MILSPRSPWLPALAALAAGCAGPFAMSPFSLTYCEGDEPRPIHCDCTRARQEVAGGRVGRVEVGEYDRSGVLRRKYYEGERRFVLLGRWLVIGVQSRSTGPSSLLAWLDCDDASIAGTIVPRAIDRDDSGVHEHEFLALFAGSPSADGTATCDLHVVFADGGGWTLHEMTEQVYAVGRVRRAAAGLEWGVTLPDDPALTQADVRSELEPPPEPAEPRLCR